jgi:hypothetical protein
MLAFHYCLFDSLMYCDYCIFMLAFHYCFSLKLHCNVTTVFFLIGLVTLWVIFLLFFWLSISFRGFFFFFSFRWGYEY